MFLVIVASIHSQSVSRPPSEMVDSIRATLLAAVDTSLFHDIIFRFVFVQSSLRKQPRATDRGAGVGASDGENSQHSRQKSARRRLTTLLGGEYGQYTMFHGDFFGMNVC
jgi:hypothetical protein